MHIISHLVTNLEEASPFLPPTKKEAYVEEIAEKVRIQRDVQQAIERDDLLFLTVKKTH